MDADDLVDIVDPNSGEVVSHCLGPSSAGSCPLAGPDGTVLCSGSRIKASSAEPEYWNLWVPRASQHCPSAWNLEAIRY